MFENFSISITTPFDWSLVIVILGAILYYFGKLINEVLPSRENDITNYVSGLFFFILFIFFPAIILYQLVHNLNLQFDLWIVAIIIFSQLILFDILLNRFQLFQISRSNLLDYLETQVMIETKKIYDMLKVDENIRKNIYSIFHSYYNLKLPNWYLFLSTIIQFILLFIVIQSTLNLAINAFSFILLFGSLSICAVLYSWNSIGHQYPSIIIYFENKKKLTGIMTKMDDAFVNIITKEKIYHIPLSQVLYIEKPIINSENNNSKRKESNASA